MTDTGLSIGLRVPGQPVPLGSEVVVEFVLANRGSATVLVNARLLAAPRHTPEALREVTFEVEGPPGYVNRKLVQINAGSASPKHFAELGPGETIVKAFELTGLESMDVPGAYAVRATYTNTVARVALLPARAWVGTISSGPGEIERV